MRIDVEMLTAHRRAILVLSFLGVLVIGYANYFSRATTEIDLWALLLAPTAAVAWVYPRRLSMVFAAYAAAAVVFSSDIADGFLLVPTGGEFVVNLGTFLSAALIVNLLAAAMDRQTHLARFDALTETINATSFEESVARELARGKRYHHPTTVAFIDIDDFKTVNDEHGHRVGDEALRCVATATRQQVRDTDTVGRLGGDEFGILMPETSEEAARVVLNRIRTRVHEIAAERIWPIGVSIGATTVAGTCTDASPDQVIRRADGAMYRVKSANKDDVLVEAFE
jgi:diguanylate cyclase (GGDEF)-like protein